MKNRAKIALASPRIKLCDAIANAYLHIDNAKKADNNGADLIVFPELSLTGATARDLYFQELIIENAIKALDIYMQGTRELSIMSFVGLPIMASDGAIYNSVVAISEGKIIGISASGARSNQFSAVPQNGVKANILGEEFLLARDNIYTDDATRANIFVQIGDDFAYSNSGVNIIINPTAMPEFIGLKKNRQIIAREVTASLGTLYVSVGAGMGESGTDGIYAAPRLAAKEGKIIFEAPLFSDDVFYVESDIKNTPACESGISAMQTATRFPFVPEDEADRKEACELALEIQARSLAMRMERSYSKKAILGVSGGLDSTLAVLVAAKAMDILGYSRDNVVAITMPCFGTTERTKSNALLLSEELGCDTRTIDIKAAVNQHFKDISHDADNYDVVYENAQARERTQILMDVANAENGLVVGTGDLSELALGFATYNGDHMSMYAVNASVPKTLMRVIIKHAADKSKAEGNDRLSSVLYDVINTPVSPELLPSDGKETAQHTESIVGPYELHDFFLYRIVMYNESPRKILDLACELFPEYRKEDIKGYLDIFLRRFFSQQFKRSCLPDGPRVTQISLSPRGAWQMPSDVSGAIWRESLKD